jgi:hypothetical protein
VRAEGGDFEDGARLDVDGLALFDYFNIANALNDGNSINARVSYGIRWSEGGTPLTIDDGANFHFDGRQTRGFISWSAREAGFSFQSDAASTTHTNVALVGRERNGVFYRL